MDVFNKLLNEELKNPEFKQEWKKLELRYIIVKQLIKLRNGYNLSQSELAKRIGTTQAVISRIENGSVNVGIDMIERIAKSFDKQIKITFS
jgi:predicted transcriptional regulator